MYKLIDLKNRLLELQKTKKTVNFKITDTFSWRGSYNEPCISVAAHRCPIEENLNELENLVTLPYDGYKGGFFRYTWNSPLNFEDDISSYSSGEYIEKFIENQKDNEDVQFLLGDYFNKLDEDESEGKTCLLCACYSPELKGCLHYNNAYLDTDPKTNRVILSSELIIEDENHAIIEATDCPNFINLSNEI